MTIHTMVVMTAQRCSCPESSRPRSGAATFAEDPDRSLIELAKELSVSPHHLSRVFRSLTGLIGR